MPIFKASVLARELVPKIADNCALYYVIPCDIYQLMGVYVRPLQRFENVIITSQSAPDGRPSKTHGVYSSISRFISAYIHAYYARFYT